MTAIILLNWNGYSDTIECLESLYKIETDFYVIVVDNGSTDDSIDHIVLFLNEHGIASRIIERGKTIGTSPVDHECIIYNLGENLGFAKGNNEALRLLNGLLPEHVLLLNNDTVAESDFLLELERYASSHPDVTVMTPLICYYSNKERVWNAGGRQFMGLRKYNYAGQSVQDIRESSDIPVTFLTGCALFFSTDILSCDGSLFTEKFFFGEEDFEFCLRMNREKKKMVCVLTAKIYHKVNASVVKYSHIGNIYIYYLNRYVDMRQHLTSAKFFIWSRCYSLYVAFLLHRKGFSWADSNLIVRKLIRYSGKGTVTQSDFLHALQCGSAVEL